MARKKEHPAKPTLYLGRAEHLRAEDLAKMCESINGYKSTPEDLKRTQDILDEIQEDLRGGKPVTKLSKEEYDKLFE